MKQDYKQAINCLAKSAETDEIGLLPFVKSIDNATFIPPAIHAMHRDIIADIIVDKYVTEEENLIIGLISEFNNQARDLPEEYSILQMNCSGCLIQVDRCSVRTDFDSDSGTDSGSGIGFDLGSSFDRSLLPRLVEPAAAS